MAVITHAFVSQVQDEGVSGEVGPSEWNAVHVASPASTNDTGVVELRPIRRRAVYLTLAGR
jgi:hypothetical protein